MTQIRYFAAAADAAGTDAETRHATTLGGLLDDLKAGRDELFARVLARCSILVDGRQTSDPAAPITDAGTVDILPPFAGGSA